MMVERNGKRHRDEAPDSAFRPTGVPSQAPAYRVLVVEDFAPIRRKICSLMATIAGLQVIGEAADGLEAVQMAADLKPDLILLDIGLPRLNGLHAAQRILAFAPQTRIIFVSQESSAEVVQQALKFSSAYVPKARIATQLLIAVNTVISERRFIAKNSCAV
jgi:DNA-binding NarL/FixJ family response regulator